MACTKYDSASAESPEKGQERVSSSYSVTPREYTSVRSVIAERLPITCSGDM